ncbi:hypothetical protein L3Y34_001006 [Caenorhabditis briggsae]|uniref:Uncharacterized protein n=1 Tax=Caenorhabditis briggsae TaxID=6238 RepID=A0AAE9DB98_CAEBR|nr:hypothetical protein L3Y34_001006 [Caenorhabditis briggsae]
MNLQYSRSFEIIDANDGSVLCADEIKEKVNRVITVISKAEIRQSDVVYINIDRGFDVVIALIACLQLKLAFTFCESNAYMYKTHPNHRKFRTTLIFDGKEVTRIAENENENHDICYVINTSGTSGNAKKQVAVPLECIKVNIEHFCTIFNVTPSDIILFSTSLLFDPSIVELFMAFHAGCRLLITPDIFRSEPHRMQKAIEKYKPTIAQFTPTVFEMLPSPDSSLSSTSSIRILLIGGSHFPLSYINSVRCSDNATRIFNVYGVTEVSCWASYFEIEIGCKEVLIGKEIMGTTLEVDANYQLTLGGPRQCYVNGNKAEKHETGDRVEKTKNGELRLVGRMDRMVKHRGVRVCLDQLTELILKQKPLAQLTYSIHFKNRDLVIFVTGASTSNDVSSVLVQLETTTSVMVHIIHVESLPINSSGKVDEYELRRICEERFSVSRGDMVKKLLKEKLGVVLDDVLDQSFVEIGVNSLLAAEISLYFGDDQENVTREILNIKTTIRKILETFGTSSCFVEKETGLQIRVSKKQQPKMKWSVDLGKCIDGNILVIRNDLVVCASHSGVIVAMNPKNGLCLWRTECKVRFECSPILANRRIVIGSKNHGLFFLCLETGKILKVIDLAVRSTCTSNENIIYCSTNDGYFHSIDPESFSLISYQQIEPNGGGTSVGPFISPDGSAIFATTTSGLFSKIFFKITNLHVSFQKKFGPIFSEPLFLEDNTVLVTSVNGVLTIINSDSGEEKDSISLKNEHCFCAPLKIGPKILVATQSGKIIRLDIKQKLNISDVFRFDLPGISFVKTPKILNLSESHADLMMISKNGWLIFGRFRNFESFENVAAFPISNKEVFTSPEVIEDDDNGKMILIAGRDDYLRSYYFEENYLF